MTWRYRAMEWLDQQHHQGHVPLIGWLVCDIYDAMVGPGWRYLARERCKKILRVFRPIDDETGTTNHQFDVMWAESEPVETITADEEAYRYYANPENRQPAGPAHRRAEPCDWADDETLGHEETMRIFDSLGPEETT